MCIKKKIKEKITYQEIVSIDNLKAGLARTKSNVFPGLDGEVKANFTEKKWNNFSKNLKVKVLNLHRLKE